MRSRSPRPTRRRFRRRTIRVLVDFVAGARVRCDYATTLGAGGLFVETEEPLPVGARLKVRFRLPDGRDVHEIEGRVVWRQSPAAGDGPVRAPGMGVEFTDAVASARLARELDRLD